ncbi:hypothetical protein EDC04DRAFT_1221265 [Pisolithus marmoratus]|nr:hypothetical protein EDC04DRAFT_1221265 [Pisolithus marmoratus]
MKIEVKLFQCDVLGSGFPFPHVAAGCHTIHRYQLLAFQACTSCEPWTFPSAGPLLCPIVSIREGLSSEMRCFRLHKWAFPSGGSSECDNEVVIYPWVRLHFDDFRLTDKRLHMNQPVFDGREAGKNTGFGYPGAGREPNDTLGKFVVRYLISIRTWLWLLTRFYIPTCNMCSWKYIVNLSNGSQ